MTKGHEPSDGWVTDLLAHLPDPTMPEDITARIDAAVRAEGPRAATMTPVTVISARRRSAALATRVPTWAAAAAAAAVIAAVAVPLAISNGSHKSTGSTAAELRTPAQAGGTAQDAFGALQLASGTNYTPGNLAQGVQRLLAPASPQVAVGVAPAASAPTTFGNSQTDSGTSGAGSGTASVTPPSDGCLSALQARESGAPLGFDVAQWSSEPAYLIVFGDPSDRAQVIAVVVATSCSSNDQHVLYEGRFRR